MSIIHLKKRRRRNASASKRFFIYERDAGICQLCGHPYLPTIGQLDHIIPISHGGSDEDENLWFVCPSCNSWKKDHFIYYDFRLRRFQKIHLLSKKPSGLPSYTKQRSRFHKVTIADVLHYKNIPIPQQVRFYVIRKFIRKLIQK